MTPADHDFDALYALYETLPEARDGDTDPLVTYQHVLRKAGLPPRRETRKRCIRILPIAALLGAAALTIAAAVYSVSDAFRGTLRVHGSAGSASEADSILERTGSLLDQSRESRTVKLSLRAAAGDDRSLKILVDVADSSGKGLAIRQPDGTKSAGSFGLRAYELTKGNGEPLAGSGNYTFINLDSAGGRCTILFDYAVMGDTIRGQTLKLHIEDILQSAEQNGTALDMEPDALYKLVTQFGPYQDSDFRLSAATDRHTYLLDAQGASAARPLSRDYPGIKITAAAVRDGSLYLQGTADSAAALDKVLENAALYHGAGSPVPAAQTSTDGGSWAVRFDGFETADSLKGYVWRYGAGEGFHTACEGSWDFTFKADFEDMAVRLAPNLRTVWEGHELVVTALEISPYSLFLQYAADEDTALRMFPPAEWGTLASSDWMDAYHPITIIMKDGTSVRAQGGSLAPKGGNLSMAPAGTVVTEYEMQYGLDTVIDPAQIASVTIGSKSVVLSPETDGK